MMKVKSLRRRDDFDDVEAAGHVPAMVPRHVGQGDEGQLSLLAVFYGFGRPAALLRPARFYFDEDEGVAVLGDNVYFSQAIARRYLAAASSPAFPNEASDMISTPLTRYLSAVYERNIRTNGELHEN